MPCTPLLRRTEEETDNQEMEAPDQGLDEAAKQSPAGPLKQNCTLATVGSRTLVPINWTGKKQTSVSRSSAESEVVSVDAGLRMDGIPAVDLWDMVVEVLQHSSSQPRARSNLLRDKDQKKHAKIKTKEHPNRDDIELFNVDQVTTNAELFHFGALKRSPRTHRVALD